MATLKHEPSLAAMNVLLDHVAKDETLEVPNIKETLTCVLETVKDDKLLRQWLLEIMGQILFLLRQNCSIWTFNFMFEMFLISLSALAHLPSHSEDVNIFPFVLTQLLKQDKYQDLGPQFAEWMLDLSRNKEYLSRFHWNALEKSWLAIKNCEGYKESSIWSRLTIVSK